MNKILNEVQYALSAIEKKQLGDNAAKTITIVVKYLLREKTSEPEIKECINELLSENGYNPVKWSKTIKSIINRQMKNISEQMLNINQIGITSNELSKIQGLDNTRLERLALVILVFSKIQREINKAKNKLFDGWIYDASEEFFKECKIALQRDLQDKMLHKLMCTGLIEFPTKVDGTGIKVNFIDSEDVETAIVINDFDNYYMEYLRWRGETVIACVECGKLELAKSNSRKYCSYHSKEKKKEATRIRVSKLRTKENTYRNAIEK